VAVSVRFIAETGEYESSIEDLIQAIRDWEQQNGVSADNVTEKFEDAIRAVVELGRRAGASADEQKRALQAIGLSAEDAEDALRAVEREAQGLGTGIPQSAEKAQDAVERLGQASEDTSKKTSGISDGAAEAGESVRGLGDIARDVLQGDMSSAIEGVSQELGELGSVGAGVGVALGIVLAAAVSQAQDAQERLEQARERAAELAQTMYEDGGQIPLTERISELIDFLSSERLARNPVENLVSAYRDLGTNIDAAHRAALAARVPFSRLLEALTGSDLGETKRALDGVNDALERMGTHTSAVEASERHAWMERREALETVKRELEDVVTQTELANQIYNSTARFNKQRIEELGEAWQSAAADASDYFETTEEGATSFDWQAYLKDAESTIAAADEMKRRLVTLPPEIRAEAERIFQSHGAVAANEYTKAYEAASAADKVRFVNAAAANGQAAGQAQAEALKRAFGNPQLDATVNVRVNDRAWRDWRPNPKTGVIMATVSRLLPRGV